MLSAYYPRTNPYQPIVYVLLRISLGPATILWVDNARRLAVIQTCFSLFRELQFGCRVQTFVHSSSIDCSGTFQAALCSNDVYCVIQSKVKSV